MRRLLWIGLALTACDDGASNEVLPILADSEIVDAKVDAGELMDMDDPADAGMTDLGEADAMPDAQVPRCAPVESTPVDGLVETAEGPVQGHREGAVWSWKNVPFAAPPVGDLRWRPPAPAECREQVHIADDFGPKCPQREGFGDTAQSVGDEDCLQLNIWSPATDDGARPVMLFIHGGGNIIGSASQSAFQTVDTYSGKHLAARGDVVVVTIQYRLGMLGYLYHPALVAESDTAGNFGLLDQIAALRWVRANITKFGGDPERVLIFGESAGARNVCANLGAPAAAGLFHRALMQSAPCPEIEIERAAEVAENAAAALSCPAGDLTCLRAVSADTIARTVSGSVGIGQSSPEGFRWGPVIGDSALPESPYQLLLDGRQHPIPLVVGSNSEEMDSAQINTVTVESVEQYERLIRGTFGVNADRVLEVYPAEAFESPNAAFIQVATDLSFTRPARAIAQAGTAGPAPTWRYLFQRQFETRMGRTPARHGIELFYVFGTYQDIPRIPIAAGDAAVGERMMDAWIRFARTGDPMGDDFEAWPQYGADARTRIFDDPPVAPQEAPRAERMQMWDAVLGPL